MAEDTGLLLAAAGAGDQASWDELVTRHNGLLWGIARGYRLGVADTGDAVQTTWLRLVENLDRIQDPERLAGWLATTVRRECLRVLRRTGRERPGPDLDEIGDLPDHADPLDAGLLADERDAALWRALAAISARCQQLLRVLMSSPPPAYAEVAVALDMPIGSIGPSRQRCLDQLRRIVSTDDLLGSPAGDPR
ncbi:RNA polymerase sigma factor [Pseudonocardia sp. GCM10023141]|uniref:RNA polymerase sigma factor n=1 Tax=Pseudonocardia sp. GCM10023141 TaxID=3252653 RepID=UPI00361528F3